MIISSSFGTKSAAAIMYINIFNAYVWTYYRTIQEGIYIIIFIYLTKNNGGKEYLPLEILSQYGCIFMYVSKYTS
jgi:hypothetical protein